MTWPPGVPSGWSVLAPDPQRPLTVLLDGDPTAPQQARLGAALAARGHTVVVLDAPQIAAQIRDEFGQQCKQLWGLPRWTGPLRRAHIHRAARQLQIDIVHLNFIKPHQRHWADPDDGPPYIATAWGSDLNRKVFQHSADHEAAIDLILRRAKAITADAWPLLRNAATRSGSGGPACHLVLWSADLGTFDRSLHSAATQQLRVEMGIAADRKILLSPRQPQPHYHIERIIHGFAHSRWAQSGVLVLKLHGKGGEDGYLQALLAQATAAGVRDRVVLAPRVPYEKLPALYAMADTAVSMPEADGVPSTFLELMALQVPIIASDLPGYEGVLTGDRALLVPPANPAALIVALNDVLDRPADTQARVTAAAQWARGNADWSKSVDQWIALYRQAVAG